MEEGSVRECYEAVKRLFENELADYDYEHIFADNRSTDGTVPILRELAAHDRRVKIIINSRNFGCANSFFNAMLAATGDAVVPCLSVDLQDPPEYIVEFAKHWENGCQIVYGLRADREENFVMHGIRKLYYRTIRGLANIDMPRNAGDFQLLDRRVVEILRQCDDYYPYLRGLVASCGFQTACVPYTMKARKKGVTKTRFYGMIDLGLNGLITLSNVPLRLCLFAGVAISLLSIGYGFLSLSLALWSIMRGAAPSAPGIPTLIVAMFFLGGIQLFFLGFIGEYVGAIHSQLRRLPLVIEEERINFGDSRSGESAPDLLPISARDQQQDTADESGERRETRHAS
jgi:glycosyltransferase involved in cell wall biosynthesis